MSMFISLTSIKDLISFWLHSGDFECFGKTGLFMKGVRFPLRSNLSQPEWNLFRFLNIINVSFFSLILLLFIFKSINNFVGESKKVVPPPSHYSFLFLLHSINSY